jgi:hypothetical protein
LCSIGGRKLASPIVRAKVARRSVQGHPCHCHCSAAGSGSVRCNGKYKVKFHPQEKRIFRYLWNIQTNLQNTNSLQQAARNACKTGSRRLRPCCRRRARSEANPTRRSS